MLDFNLDKTPDGRFWTLEAEGSGETVLRWRIDYFARTDVAGVFAEVGNRGTDGEIVWTCVATFDVIPEGASGDRGWMENLPDVWRQDFIQMGRVLGLLTRIVELGPTGAYAWASRRH